MPTGQIKSLAKKSGKSEREVEKLWKDAIKITAEEFGIPESKFKDRQYKFTYGVVKNMLGIKESIIKEAFLQNVDPSMRKNIEETLRSAFNFRDIERIEQFLDDLDEEIGLADFSIDRGSNQITGVETYEGYVIDLAYLKRGFHGWLKHKDISQSVINMAPDLYEKATKDRAKNEKIKEVQLDASTRKEFIGYAKEIIENLMQYHPGISYREIRNTVWKIMQTMALEENNPNYKNMEKYMPKTFNKFLFDNGRGDMYDSMWFSLRDEQHSNIIKNALQSLGIEESTVIKKKDSMKKIKKLKSFFECGYSAKEYAEFVADDEYPEDMYYDEEEYTDIEEVGYSMQAPTEADYDFQAPIESEYTGFQHEQAEDEIEIDETMTSGAFSGVITGPIIPPEEEEDYVIRRESEMKERYKMPSSYERFLDRWKEVQNYMRTIKSRITDGEEWGIGKGLEDLRYTLNDLSKLLKTLEKDFNKGIVRESSKKESNLKEAKIITKYLYTMKDYMKKPSKVQINDEGWVISINNKPIDPTPIEDYGEYYLSDRPIPDAFDRYLDLIESKKKESNLKEVSYDKDIEDVISKYEKKDYWDEETQIKDKIKEWESYGKPEPYTAESIRTEKIKMYSQERKEWVDKMAKKFVDKDERYIREVLRYDQEFTKEIFTVVTGIKTKGLSTKNLQPMIDEYLKS